MRTLLVVALLVVVALAGCSGGKGKGSDGDGSSSSGTGSGSSSSTKTGTGPKGSSSSSGTGVPPAPNHKPNATLTAETLKGAIPFKVNFTANATDADGDPLTWTLSFGDGSSNATGDALPADLVHNYTAAGLYNATLRVSDGKDQAIRKLVINATADSGAKATKQFTGTAVFDPNAAAAGFCADDILASAGTGGTVGNSFAVEGAWVGWTYAVVPATLLVTFFTGNAFPSGHAGTVPAGATQVAVCASSPTDTAKDFTLTLTQP